MIHLLLWSTLRSALQGCGFILPYSILYSAALLAFNDAPGIPGPRSHTMMCHRFFSLVARNLPCLALRARVPHPRLPFLNIPNNHMNDTVTYSEFSL